MNTTKDNIVIPPSRITYSSSAMIDDRSKNVYTGEAFNGADDLALPPSLFPDVKCTSEYLKELIKKESMDFFGNRPGPIFNLVAPTGRSVLVTFSTKNSRVYVRHNKIYYNRALSMLTDKEAHDLGI